MRTAIIGGGAAGLSLALMLKGDVTVFEKTGELGGLCRSHVVPGYTFDRFGPHILGGIPEAVDWIVASTGIEFVDGETNNVGWVNGEFVAHPFADGGMGRRYMEKMWKHDPDALAKPDLGAQQGRRPGGVSKFRYPAKGGYQSIVDAWAKAVPRVQLTCGFTLTSVKTLWAEYDHIVWCAPVPGMTYNTLTTATMRYKGAQPPFTAIYIPDASTPIHRLSFPSSFAPGNCREGEFIVQCELSGGGAYPLARSRLRDIGERMGWGVPITGSDELNVAQFAYPLPDGQRPGGDLVFHGRSGGHQYLNLDGVVKASMDLAAKLNGESGR